MLKQIKERLFSLRGKNKHTPPIPGTRGVRSEKDRLVNMNPLELKMRTTAGDLKLVSTGIKTVYYHDGCTDGNAARCILEEEFGSSVEYVPVPPQYSGPVKHPALFVDLCPAEDVAIDVLSRRGLILDHHSGTKTLLDKLDSMFPGRVFYGDNKLGQSGAVMADIFTEIISPREQTPFAFMSEGARLVGIRDCWVKESPDFEKAKNYVEYIGKFGNNLPSLPEPEYIEEFTSALAVNSADVAGRTAAEACWEKIKTGSGQTINVAFVNTLGITECSELLRNEGANLIVGWRVKLHGEPSLFVSLRSDKSLDCSELAKYYGGGGHAQASGFNVKYEIEVSPMLKLSGMIEAFMNRHN